MSAHLIDGKSIASHLTERVRRDAAALGYVPTLAVVLVGDNPASHQYVRLKEAACRKVGIAFERLSFAEDATIEMIIRAVENLNKRQDVDGILVQLPLPRGLDEDAVIQAMDPEKDVDGFHPDNVAGLMNGNPRLIPGLAAGILALAKATGEELRGKKAVVIANSQTFFSPVDVVLKSAGMQTQYVSPDDDVLVPASQADLVVIAIGRAHFLIPAMVKPGAIVIDVGTNKLDGKTVGDVDPSVAAVAGHITPVPGGVGPMTVAMLLKNTVDLAKKRRGAHGSAGA